MTEVRGLASDLEGAEEGVDFIEQMTEKDDGGNVVGLIGLLSAGPIDPESVESGPRLVMMALLILPVSGMWAAWLSWRIGQVAGHTTKQDEALPLA